MLLLGWAYWNLTNHIHYFGDFQAAVVMPLVTVLPEAVVAVGVGASVAWLVESKRPLVWAIWPSVLYAVFSQHWARPPMLVDRIAQVIGAAFLAVACLFGAIIAIRRQKT